jgi:hypothetical protein
MARAVPFLLPPFCGLSLGLSVGLSVSLSAGLFGCIARRYSLLTI